MTKEEIIRLAQQAGYKDTPTIRAAYYGFNLEHFVEQIIQTEREACAKLCEAPSPNRTTLDGPGIRALVGKQLAAAIRDRQ